MLLTVDALEGGDRDAANGRRGTSCRQMEQLQARWADQPQKLARATLQLHAGRPDELHRLAHLHEVRRARRRHSVDSSARGVTNTALLGDQQGPRARVE